MAGKDGVKARVARALRDARYTRGVIGTVADLLTLVTFIGSAAALASSSRPAQTLLATYLCLVSMALLVLLLQLEARLGRRARQSDAMPDFA